MGIINREGSLYLATGIDNSGLYAGRREAMGIIKAMAGQITSFDVFSGIGISAATAFASAAKSSYDFEKEFQKNMLEVATISTQVTDDMTGFMNQIMSITQEIPIKAPEAAKALYSIVSAGHDGADGMKILEVSAKAAVGGLTETETAADAITTILNAYKMSAEEAGTVSDQLFTTVRLGKTTFGQLGASIAQVAPIAAAYGISIDQVLGAVASLTKQGTPTAQAMTQIRAAIQGTAGELGDAAFQGRTFQEALQLINEKAGGSASKMKEMLGTDEGLAATLALTGKNAKSAASDLGELQNSLGATEAAFEKMKDAADNQMTLLSNNIQAALRPMGQAILKEVSDVAKSVNEAFENGDVERAIKSLGDLIVIVTGAFIGYKGAVTASTVAQNIHTKALVVSRLASIQHITTSKLMTNAIKAQTVALLKNIAALATNPYVLAAAAVAALGYGLYKYATQATAAEKATAAHNKRVKELSEWADKTKESVDGMLSSLKDENVLMSKKVEIYRNLQSLYPDELKNISLQNFLLMDSVQANNLLAKALDDRIKAQQRADVNTIEAEMKTNDSRIATLDSKSGMDTSVGEWFELRRLKSRNEQLKIEYEKAKDIVIQGVKDETAARKAIEDLNNDNEKGETVLQRKIALTKELSDAEANLKKLRASGSTAKNSEIKAAEEKVKEVKGKLEALTGISGKEGDKLKQAQTDLARSILDNELKLQADRIAALEDGKAKRLALINQEYNETIAAINKERAEYDKKVKEAGGVGSEAVYANFDSRKLAAGDKQTTDIAKVNKEYIKEFAEHQKQLSDVFLSEEARRLTAVKDRYDKEREWADQQLRTGGMTKEQHESYTEDIDQAENQENIKALLDKYQDYDAKRREIDKRYNEEVATLSSERTEVNKAEVNAAIVEARKRQKEEIASLDFSEFQDTDLWKKMFGDLDKMAVSTLENILKKAKEVNTSAWTPEQIKEYQDAIDRLEDNVKTRSPFKSLQNDWKSLMKALKEGSKDDVVKALDGIDKSVQKINDDLKTIAGGIGDIFGDEAGYAAEQVTELTSALGGFVTGASKLASGDILGGISSVISSIGSIFSIGKKVKEMNAAARAEQQKFYDEARAGELEYHALLRERLRITQQIGETSLQYFDRLQKELHSQSGSISKEYDEVWSKLMGEQYIEKVNYRHGTWFRKAKTWNDYGDLSGKSYEEIESLYTQNKLTDSAKILFEQLRKLKEEGADVVDMMDDLNQSMTEAWTGTTEDAIAQSILNGISAGKNGVDDLTTYFRDMMKKAMLQGVNMKYLQEPIKNFYKQFADMSESDGMLTESEIQQLQDMYTQIVENAQAQFDNLQKVSGLDFSENGTSDNSLKGAYAKASQESIDLLAGQTGAQRVAIESIREQMQFIRDLQVQGWKDVTAIKELVGKLKEVSDKIYDAVDEIKGHTGELSEYSERTVNAVEGTLNVKVKM